MSDARARLWIAVSMSLVLAANGCTEKTPPSKEAETTARAGREGADPANLGKAPARPPAAGARLPSRPKSPAPPDRAASAAPAGGTLRIDSDVPGALVFIDRQYVGTTPVTASNVAPGAHQLNLSAQGYDGIAQRVDVEPGPRDVLFRFKEVRLDAVIDVVHKHRLGSCQGRLAATPQGLRYEPTDGDDAFTAPLSALERFDVDYLAKVLHVKLTNGKQYEFTDPEGNADRLFVFHRDVAAAKKKLGGAP